MLVLLVQVSSSYIMNFDVVSVGMHGAHTKTGLHHVAGLATYGPPLGPAMGLGKSAWLTSQHDM